MTGDGGGFGRRCAGGGAGRRCPAGICGKSPVDHSGRWKTHRRQEIEYKERSRASNPGEVLDTEKSSLMRISCVPLILALLMLRLLSPNAQEHIKYKKIIETLSCWYSLEGSC